MSMVSSLQVACRRAGKKGIGILRTYSKIQRGVDTYTTLASREQPHVCLTCRCAVSLPALLIDCTAPMESIKARA
eukprot:scaffold204_cov100-Skeletonema_dohrnii-CCMP3373.AAC.5